MDMVSNISFIHANLRNSTSASRVLSRTVSVIETDNVLLQELWYHEGHVSALEYSRIYPVLREWNMIYFF